MVKFEIWDTAGQERYRSLAPMSVERHSSNACAIHECSYSSSLVCSCPPSLRYYRGAAAALVVYDITSHESFLGAKTWSVTHCRESTSPTSSKHALRLSSVPHSQCRLVCLSVAICPLLRIEELQRQGSADIVIGLSGNKSDLESKREVPRTEAEAYANENGCIFFETSAKSGDNVQSMFTQIAVKLPKHVAPQTADDIQIISPDEEKKKGCC
jgi:GTPase SAR1 family protein